MVCTKFWNDWSLLTFGEIVHKFLLYLTENFFSTRLELYQYVKSIEFNMAMRAIFTLQIKYLAPIEVFDLKLEFFLNSIVSSMAEQNCSLFLNLTTRV